MTQVYELPMEGEHFEAFQQLYNIQGQTPLEGDPSNAPCSESSDEDMLLPPCLRDAIRVNGQTPGVGYPCLVCAQVKATPKELVDHVDGFHTVNEDPEQAESVIERTCSYCGRLFPSTLVKVLHQMSFPLTHVCSKCYTEFASSKELKRHMCLDEPRAFRGKCAMGCTEKYRFESVESIKQHFLDFHGFDPAKNKHEDLSLKCPMCHVLLNPSNMPLQEHLKSSCLSRSEYYKECVRSITDLAEESGVDVDLLIRLETEAFDLPPDRESLSAQIFANHRYGLDTEFSDRVLTKVHSLEENGPESNLTGMCRWLLSNGCLSMSFLKETAEHEVTSTTLDVKDHKSTLTQMYRTVRQLLRANRHPDKQLHPRNPSMHDVKALSREPQPDPEVLQSLEEQLDFRILGNTQQLEDAQFKEAGYTLAVGRKIGSRMSAVLGAKPRADQGAHKRKRLSRR